MTSPVAIVGASIAGLTAAHRLRQGGLPVQVYEARSEASPAPRTLIVTPAWLRLLDVDAGDAVLNRIHTFELISRSASARVPLKEPDLILERQRFVDRLARQVRCAGGAIHLEHRVERVIPRQGGCELTITNGGGAVRSAAPRVIAADGVHSVAAGTPSQQPEPVALRQARVVMPPDLDPHTVRVWFDRGSTRFFTWLIPASSRSAVAGLIADTPSQAREALDTFLAAQDLDPRGYQAAQVPMAPLQWGRDGHGADGRLILIGDAASQVKTTTVGGVVTGMRGGQAAARALLRGTAYGREMRALQRELNAHTLLRAILDGFGDDDYDDLLRLLNQGASQILGAHTRDELARGLWWRLIAAQPRWLTLTARALLRSAV